MANFKDDVRYIKGIGEKRAKSLQKLGVNDLGTLITNYPRRYDDRRKTYTISSAPLDEYVTITAMITEEARTSRLKNKLELTKIRACDDTGSIDISFFNQSYIKDKFLMGETFRFFGKVSKIGSKKSMTNPVFEAENIEGFVTGRIVPVYKLTAGLSQTLIMKAVSAGLDFCKDVFPDYLPNSVRENFALAQARYAYHNIHFPESDEALENARRRLIFEELFVFTCAIKLMGGQNKKTKGTKIPRHDMSEFYKTLPFSPTNAQIRAVDEALSDLQSGFAMNRLIQGDVGSGKTLAATALIWSVVKSGFQAAFMVPTEILAEQHFKTISSFLSPFNINVVLLKGSMGVKAKREAYAKILSGDASLIIGTHALISEGVAFHNLKLVITDEQHRFGVRQRSALADKAERAHVLVMSATPIPRTLALMLYGDLDVSIIDELPPGRQGIETFAVSEGYRKRIDAFIDKQCAEKKQVFVVCPAIEENPESMVNLHSAEDEAVALQSRHTHLKVACVHGKMKAKEKEAIMSAFSVGEFDVLVSTTVIEVGVDVPNSSLMIVENAERFGLSQLHQLRGRVGRGGHKSYCILISNTQNPETKKRLDALCKTSNGFVLAEEDLKLRGPGDFFGSRQHGLPEMRIADLCTDTNVLRDAQEAAEKVLASDPKLLSDENSALSQRLENLFEINRGTIS